ncbi:heme-degrading domain-containing protein [Agrobacterium tumefaciens]|uniref:heme-degrading domain-containing protein n=1 Tax=Agrobacterium tumefaciens TaxID=358 RepID=UPI001572621D|nr:heme-binding protein [Agrobacterium tumefaciens]WCJ64178.1 heme-binding protein [Agrobacterium tumefaciens]
MTESTPSLAALAEEQNSLKLEAFNYEFAWALGQRIRHRAYESNLPVAIEVRHGMDVIFATLVGSATIDNFDWTRRKCAAVHRFHRSSLQLRLEAEEGGYDFNQKFKLPPADYVASGGGVPLILKGGTLIGTVAVSGLPNVQDHNLVVSVLREFLS